MCLFQDDFGKKKEQVCFRFQMSCYRHKYYFGLMINAPGCDIVDALKIQKARIKKAI